MSKDKDVVFQAARRRTFAIISNPDAGKTTRSNVSQPVEYPAVPRFAPEICATARPILAAVGALQFEVVSQRF